MRAWAKQKTGRVRPATRMERVPPWNGQPTVVKLNDWASFAAANHLRVVRSRIAGDEGGVLRIEVEVEGRG